MLTMNELSPDLSIVTLYQTQHFNLSSNLQKLSLYDFQVESGCLGREVAQMFKSNPLIPGVILTESGEFLGIISRRQFLEHISRPYGRELFLGRPIRCLYLLANADVLRLPKETSILQATRQCLQRPADRIYEPLLVEIEPKVYRLLDVHELLIAQSNIHELTNQLLNRQTQIQKNTLEQLHKEIAVRNRVELALKKAKEELESRVEERTAQLRDSEQRFRFLAQIIPQQVWTTQPDGSLDYVNGRVLDYFGIRVEQILGTGWQDMLHPEDLPQCLERWSKSLATGEPYETEFRLFQAADKTYRWHIGRALPRFDKEGRIIGWFGTNTDIHQQKQTEATLQLANEELEMRVQKRTAQLQKSEQKYRSVVDNVKEVIFQTDTTGLWTFLNPAWTEITGFSLNESIGTSFLDYVHPDDLLTQSELFQTLIQHQKESDRREIRCLTRSGTYRWLEVFVYPTIEAGGSILGISGTLNDITSRKLAEEETRRALEKEKELNLMKTRFLSMAAHDLRTPMATILTSSDLLKSFGYKFSEEKKQHHLNKIQTAVKNMTMLLDDVLFFGKGSSGRIEFNPVPLNLEAFCQDVFSEISLTDNKKHTFSFECHGDCSLVESDEKLMRKLLTNLLSNAVKYSPEATTVHLNVVCENEQAIINVQDSGIGIPESDRTRLFEVFHRCSNVGNVSGTGLGMAIVQQAVELHGGNISFESAVGVGTTFTVCIPTRQQKA